MVTPPAPVAWRASSIRSQRCATCSRKRAAKGRHWAPSVAPLRSRRLGTGSGRVSAASWRRASSRETPAPAWSASAIGRGRPLGLDIEVVGNQSIVGVVIAEPQLGRRSEIVEARALVVAPAAQRRARHQRAARRRCRFELPDETLELEPGGLRGDGPRPASPCRFPNPSARAVTPNPGRGRQARCASPVHESKWLLARAAVDVVARIECACRCRRDTGSSPRA